MSRCHTNWPVPRRDIHEFSSDYSSQLSSETEQSSDSESDATTPTPTAKETPIGLNNSKNNKIYYIIAIVVTLAAIYYAKFHNVSTSTKCDLSSLNEKYPSYNNVIYAVENLITTSTKAEKKQLGVFLFITTDDKTNVQNFITTLAANAAICLNDGAVYNLTLHEFQICPNDYGCAVKSYKENTKINRVTVIHTLNDVPIKFVPALHHICDTVDPIVTPAINFLTLTLRNKNATNLAESAKIIAYKELDSMWYAMNRNERAPLLARVTDQVFRL